MVALSPCRSPSPMMGRITSTAPESTRAFLDPGHWARLSTTKSEKSSRELDVQRLGEVVVFRRLSTTHLGMSVFPRSLAFSSLLAKFLMSPHAQRTPSDFPDPDFGTVGELVKSFSRTRRRELELERGAIAGSPSATGECCKMVVILASKKDRFMRQMQHK